MMRPTTWLVGDARAACWRATIAWLEARCQVRRLESLAAALVAGDEVPPPELMVLLSPRPGMWSHRQLDAVLARWPLVRLVSIEGSWCEGAARSSTPYAQMVRVYWHQAPIRLAELIGRWQIGCAGPLSLPSTAAEAERISYFLARTPASYDRVVGVCGEHPELLDVLAGALRPWCRSVVRFEPCRPRLVTGLDQIFWQLNDSDDGWGRRWPAIQAAHPTAPTVAVLGFPRPHQAAAMRAAGLACVVSLPMWLGDLTGWLAPS